MILFVRSGALGDFCLTAPVLAALYATGRRVDIMCQPRFATIAGLVAARVPGASPGRVWDADGAESLWLFAGKPATLGKYALAFAFSTAHAEALVEIGVPDVRHVASRPPRGVSAGEHFCSIWPCDRGFRLAGGGDAGGAGPVVLAPGSAGEDKRWPMERWREVARLLEGAGHDVRWVGGPLEPWATERPDLSGLVELAARSKAWIGADSGPGHLAALAGARVGVIGREESRQWLPTSATFFDWDTPAGCVAGWVDHPGPGLTAPGCGAVRTPSRP